MIYKIVLFFFSLLATQARAQDPLRLTPEDAVRLGLEKNQEIQAYRAQTAESRAVFRQVRARQFPSVRGQASYLRLSDNIPELDLPGNLVPGLDSAFTIFPVILDRYNAQVDVEQPIFTGFRLRNQVKAAALESEAAVHDLVRAEVETAFHIRQAYWELVRTSVLVGVADQSLKQVETHLTDVENRRRYGTALDSDVLSVRVRRSEMRLRKLEAENRVRITRLNLNHAMGLSLDQSVEPVASMDAGPEPPGLDQELGTALTDHPALQSLDRQMAALDARVDAARGAWWPSISATGQYQYARPNPYFYTAQDQFKGTWQAGFSLTWDIWDWGQRRAEIGQAKARVNSAGARLAYQREATVLAVNRAFLELKNAEESITVANEGLRDAEEAYRSIQNRFKEGAALTSELLDAETALLSARSNQVEARANYAIARAELLRSSGKIW